MENYNKIIRKQIVDDIETILVKQYCSLKEAIKIYHIFLLNRFKNDSKETEIIKTMYLSILYLDSYKLLLYKQKHGINKPIETEYLYKIDSITSFYNLIYTLENDPDLFCKMIEETYNYEESNGLTKRIMIKSLSQTEKEKITEITSLHELDEEQTKEELSLEKIIKNLKSQNKYYNKVMTIKFDEGIALQTSGLIKELYTINPNDIRNLIIQLAIKDYKISKYIVDKIKDNEKIKYRINKYETLSINQIIEFIIKEDEILIDIIYQLIDLYINKSYLEIPLEEQEIDQQEDIITKKLKNNK